MHKKKLLLQRRESQFSKDGRMVSSRLLLEDSLRVRDLRLEQQNVSEVYLPASKRQLQSKVEPSKEEL